MGGMGGEEIGKGMLFFIGLRDMEVWCFCGLDGVVGEGIRLWFFWGRKLDVF